jgi:hypothetical protein
VFAATSSFLRWQSSLLVSRCLRFSSPSTTWINVTGTRDLVAHGAQAAIIGPKLEDRVRFEKTGAAAVKVLRVAIMGKPLRT